MIVTAACSFMFHAKCVCTCIYHMIYYPTTISVRASQKINHDVFKSFQHTMDRNCTYMMGYIVTGVSKNKEKPHQKPQPAAAVAAVKAVKGLKAQKISAKLPGGVKRKLCCLFL